MNIRSCSYPKGQTCYRGTTVCWAISIKPRNDHMIRIGRINAQWKIIPALRISNTCCICWSILLCPCRTTICRLVTTIYIVRTICGNSIKDVSYTCHFHPVCNRWRSNTSDASTWIPSSGSDICRIIRITMIYWAAGCSCAVSKTCM